ncbi:hypothetical protein ACHAPJ_005251 [Fusarium lateritium]
MSRSIQKGKQPATSIRFTEPQQPPGPNYTNNSAGRAAYSSGEASDSDVDQDGDEPSNTATHTNRPPIRRRFQPTKSNPVDYNTASPQTRYSRPSGIFYQPPIRDHSWLNQPPSQYQDTQARYQSARESVSQQSSRPRPSSSVPSYPVVDVQYPPAPYIPGSRDSTLPETLNQMYTPYGQNVPQGYPQNPRQYNAPGYFHPMHFVTPPPPPPESPPRPTTPVPLRPDPEKVRLEAEIAALKAAAESQKAAERQKEAEGEIRKAAEEAFYRRMEEMKRAQEDAKDEIEKARLDAEKVTREKMESERMAEEAIKRREEEQAQRMERDIRFQLEQEKKAKKAAKEDRETYEGSLETMMKIKMLERLDDFMEVAKERLKLVMEGPSSHRNSGLEPESEIQSEYDKAEGQSIGQEEALTNNPPLSRHQPVHESLSAHSLASPSVRTAQHSPTPTNTQWEEHPPAVPDPPAFLSGSDEGGETPGPSRSRNIKRPGVYWETESQSRGRARHRRTASDAWYRDQQGYRQSQTPINPDFVRQVANAVASILRKPIYDEDVMPQSTYSGWTPHDFSRQRQPPFDHMAHLYAADRAAAYQAQTRRREDLEPQHYRARQFDPSNMSPYVQRQQTEGHFERESPLDTIPRTRQTSLERVIDGDPDVIGYGSPELIEQSASRNRDMFDGNRIRAPVANGRSINPNIEAGETSKKPQIRRNHRTTQASDESMTWVNSEMSVGATKSQDQMPTSTIHGSKPKKGIDEGVEEMENEDYLTPPESMEDGCAYPLRAYRKRSESRPQEIPTGPVIL